MNMHNTCKHDLHEKVLSFHHNVIIIQSVSIYNALVVCAYYNSSVLPKRRIP